MIAAGGGSGLFTSDTLGTVERLEPETIEAARRVVAGAARDAEDAAFLLAALDLDGAA